MIFDPAFVLYAMEQEGYLDTRESEIHRVAKELAKRPQPWYVEDIEEISPGSYFNPEEINRIIHEAYFRH